MDIYTRNNVRDFGRGTQPMMFAHGFGCDQTIWRSITPEFEERFRIILFDYVGSGNSMKASYKSSRYCSLDGYAQDVLDICKALDLKDVIFVGHSVSAMIGMLAARTEPHLFKAMIMAAPNACYVNEPGYEGGFELEELEALVATVGNGTQWTSKLAPVVMGNADRPMLAQQLESLFCALDPAIAKEFARITFLSDHRAMLREHTLPTLVMQCSDDAVAPVSAGEYIRRYMQNSTLVQMKATGHMPHISAPQETVKLMWDYLSHSMS